MKNLWVKIRPDGVYGFFRTRLGEEIDLVVEHGGKRVGFEFKTSSKPQINSHNKKVFGWLNLEKLFLVTPQGEAYPIEGDRIWVCPLDKLKKNLPREFIKNV